MIQLDDIQKALAYGKAGKEKLATIQQSLETSFQGICDNLKALQQKVPKDAGGDADGTWNDLPQAEQEQLLTQIHKINEQLDAIYDQSHVATFSQLKQLLIVTGIVMFVCLGACFLCICKGAFPLSMDRNVTLAHITTLTNVTVLTNEIGDNQPLTLTHVTTLTNRINLKRIATLNNGITLTNGATLEHHTNQLAALTVTNGTLLASEYPSNNDKDTPKASFLGTDRITPHPAYVVLMLICLGALGGCLRLIGSSGYYYAKKKFYSSWLIYYYLMPVEGALLALFVCLMFNGGYFDLSSVQANAGETGGSALSSISSFYALACFSGLFAKNVLRKLKDTVDILFGKVSTKDAA